MTGNSEGADVPNKEPEVENNVMKPNLDYCVGVKVWLDLKPKKPVGR